MKHKCETCGKWLDNQELVWGTNGKRAVFKCKDTSACAMFLRINGKKDCRDWFEYHKGYERYKKKKKSFRDGFITVLS